MRARLRRLARRAVRLPAPIALPLGAALCALAVCAAARDLRGPMAYLIYLASAWGLAVLLAALPQLVRALRRSLMNFPPVRALRATGLYRRLRGDHRLRARISLGGGLCINLAYIAIKLYTGLRYRSLWFLSLAAYHALLALMRYLLLRGSRLDARAAWRRICACGALLMMMNQALLGIIALIKYRGASFVYPGNLIYAMACYAFYAVIHASAMLVRSRRQGDPIYSAARSLSLVSAMVSLLSLETALMARFGGDDLHFRQLMTSISGGWICLIVLSMAISMLARSTRALRRLSAQRAKRP